MRRIRAIMGLVVLIGLEAASARGGPYMSQYWNKGTPDGVHWGPQYLADVPAVQGAGGEPVPMVAPYNAQPPNGAAAAQAMLQQSMPLDLLQQSGYFKDGATPILPVGGPCPGGVCPAPGMGMGMPPGNLISPPGIAGMPPGALPPGMRPPGAVAAVGALTGAPSAPFPIQRTEVRFVNPAGMKIAWFGPSADGKGGFGPQYLEAPARYNFLQASIYRLKLSDIPNRPGLELYPTLEVVPSKQKTCTFLSHSAVPIAFTDEDFEQAAAGNFVVKVIYLPDPQFQDLAATGPDEVVSSRLEPGVDPIIEAKRRGSILLVVRLGNIDLEAPNTPPMDAPNPFAPPPPPAAPPGMMPPGMMPPGMPGMPGMPMAGQPPAPNMPNQMAPNMPARPPMVPYGMLNGQPPQAPYGMPNGQPPQAPYGMPNGQPPQGSYGMPNGQPPQVPYGMPNGQPSQAPYGMLNGQPPQQGTPQMQPNAGMLSPGQMLPPPPGTTGAYPPNMQFPGQPGTPLGQAAPSTSVQPAQFQQASQTPQRRPTLAELAGQPTTWGPPPVNPPTPPSSQ